MLQTGPSFLKSPNQHPLGHMLARLAFTPALGTVASRAPRREQFKAAMVWLAGVGTYIKHLVPSGLRAKPERQVGRLGGGDCATNGGGGDGGCGGGDAGFGGGKAGGGEGLNQKFVAFS